MPVEMRSFSVDLRGSEASEIFLEPVYTDPSIMAQFRMMPSVVSKKKMLFAQDLEKVVRKYAGCGFKPVGNFNIYERSVEVEHLSADIEQCWDEFKDTIIEELFNRGVRFPDMTDTLLGDILRTRAQEAVQRDITRLAYFGDAASSNKEYNAIDGLWEVYYPELVADSLIPRAMTGSGSAITSGNGIDILKDVTEQADIRLKKIPNNLKVLNVSGSVWEAYRTDLENNGGGDGGRTMMIDGAETLFFRGILVNPMWDWNIYKDEIDSTTNNHLVEYTTRLNKVMASDIATGSPEAQWKVFYDEKEEKMCMKTRFKMGVNFIHPSLISVGY